MCNVCCQEFAAWCKSFTPTERVLTIIECILLVVFIGFLTFLILHLIVCTKPETSFEPKITTTVRPNIEYLHDTTTKTSRQTLGPNVECTWNPSHKTKATTHYYDFGQPPGLTTAGMHKPTETKEAISVEPLGSKYEDWEAVEQTDGEEPQRGFDKFVIALVKMKPMQDVTFGCILTVVSEYWTLTAASCIEAVEEVDSLDAFVMVERRDAGARAVADVRLHPLYAGANRSYDLAALRSDRALPRARPALRLPAIMDPLLLTVGERLTVLGYGSFRSVDTGPRRHEVRAARVYSLPGGACAGAAGPALRHLWRGQARAAGACGARGLCAGVLHARGLACYYCAGTPLLAGATLLGIMADSQHCGESCEPAWFVNLAALRDWIDSVLYSDQI